MSGFTRVDVGAKNTYVGVKGQGGRLGIPDLWAEIRIFPAFVLPDLIHVYVL